MVRGAPLSCLSERQVFERLGLDYKEPWERNCFDGDNQIPLAELEHNALATRDGTSAEDVHS